MPAQSIDLQGVNAFVEGILHPLKRPVPEKSTPAIASQQNLPFGFVEEDVEASKPPHGIFNYGNVDYKVFDPEQLHFPPVLHPIASATPPLHMAYPISPTWTLRKSCQLLGGWYYHSDISTSPAIKTLEQDRMNSLTTPTQLQPVWDELKACYHLHPIPGMVRMIPGAIFCQHLDGNPEDMLFIGALQTRESLLRYGADGKEAVSLLEKLHKCAWGDPTTKTRPLYTIEGLRTNDRSRNHNGLPYVGSMSLATTVEKGHGPGKVVPAIQPTHQESLNILHQTLLILSKLHHLISKICLPKREFDLINFNAIENNLFSFGGLLPGAVSVQLNCSASLNVSDLIEHIGSLQGSWHVDQSDHVTRVTVFILFFRLPKGAAPGPFLLGRPGLYAQELGEGTWYIVLMFRARDMHSGSSPWVHPSQKHTPEMSQTLKDLDALWEQSDAINRLGFVLYSSVQAVDRDAPLCVGPETRFGNHNVLGESMSKSLNFSQNGQHLLGTMQEAKTRLAWERTFDFFNGLALDGLVMEGFKLSDFISRIRYKTGDGPLESVIPFPMDDEARVSLFRSYYKDLLLQCRRILLPLTKFGYNTRMQGLRKEKTQVFHPRERLPVRSTEIDPETQKDDSEDEDDLGLQSVEAVHPPKITKVLERKVDHQSGKRFWLLMIDGVGGPIWVDQEQGAGWMFSEGNKSTFSSFIFNETQSPLADPRVAHSTTHEPSTGNHDTLNGSSSPATAPPNLTLPSPAVLQGLGASVIEPVIVRKRPSPRSSLQAKKKRKTNKSFTQEGSSLSDDSEEDRDLEKENYKISYIIGHHATKDGKWEFNVRWTGYIADNTPTSLHDLETGAPAIFKSYKDAHPELNNPPSEDLIREAKCRSLALRSTLCPEALQALAQALSVTGLEKRLREFEARQMSLSKPEYQAMITPVRSLTRCYQQLAETNASMNTFNTFLEISPIVSTTISPDSDLENMNQHFIVALSRASDAAKLFPYMASASLGADIQCAYFRWEYARNCLVIYDFVKNGLPRMADWLFSSELGIISSDIEDNPTANVSSSSLFPRFRPLVLRCFEYLLAHRREYHRKYRRATKGKGKPKRNSYRNDVAAEELREIPSDVGSLIFGRDIPESSKYLLSKATKSPGKSLVADAKRCFMETILDLFVIPHLREASEVPPSQKGHPQLNLCVMRGAVVSRIAAAVGSDVIFCSPDLDFVLQSPQLLFEGNETSKAHFWINVRDKEHDTLRPLEKFLRDLDICSRVCDLAYHIKEFINHHFLEIQCGRRISEDEYYRSYIPPAAQRGKNPNRQKVDKQSRTSIAVESLLPQGSPQLGILALILRECLNKEQGWPFANEQIRRCMDGGRASDGRVVSQFENLDHWNPIRHRNISATLFVEKLPGAFLTREHGLSNILTWMGTGQGPRTKGFLDTSHPASSTSGASSSFYSRSLDACIDMFERGMDQRLTYLSSKSNWNDFEDALGAATREAGSGSLPRDLPQLSDSRVWGQPNPLLSIARSKEFHNYHESIRATLSQFWTPCLQEKWAVYLGSMLNQDPNTYSGEKPTWGYTLNWVHGLDIDSFRSGSVTALQTVNNLCFSRICLAPTLDEISDFVWQNDRLGAYRGLTALGFSLFSSNAVKAALFILHSHLKDCLGEREKEILGFESFSWIFVEHLLCKISRFVNRIEFTELWGGAAQKEGRYKRDRMDEDRLYFPIELQIENSSVQRLLDAFNLVY